MISRAYLIRSVGIFLLIFSMSVLSHDEKRRLKQFKNIDAFEQHLQQRKRDCLDKSLGGSQSVACFKRYSDAWETELNYYYNLLKNTLDVDARYILEKSQLSWRDNKAETIFFNSSLLDKKYKDK